jgi:hypothetical protein
MQRLSRAFPTTSLNSLVTRFAPSPRLANAALNTVLRPFHSNAIHLRGAAPPANPQGKPVTASVISELKDIKADLLKAVKEEIDDYSDEHALKPEDLKEYETYVKELKMSITPGDANGTVRATRTQNGYDVAIRFNENADEDEPEEIEKDAEEETEATEEGQRGAADADVEDRDPVQDEQVTTNSLDGVTKHSFDVDLKPAGKTGPVMRVHAVAGKDERLYIEGLSFYRTTADVEADDRAQEAVVNGEPSNAKSNATFLEYDLLPEYVQDKLADMLDLLRIDDQTARFVQTCAAASARRTHTKKLDLLQAFL